MSATGLSARGWKPRTATDSTLGNLWATPLRRAFLVTGVWRVAVGIWAIAAHGMAGQGPYASQTLMRTGWSRNPFTLLIDAGVRMDAWWYVRIVEHGYTFSTRHISSIVFYPLYPLLIKAVSLITGNVFLAGMLISTLCLFLSVLVLQRWLDGRGLGNASAMTLGVMLCFPFGFFWVSMYTESLFLFLALATFIFFEKQRFAPAATCAFLAVLARPTGLILAPCLAAMILAGWHPSTFLRRSRTANEDLSTDPAGPVAKHERQDPSTGARVAPWLAVAAGPVGWAAFAVYQWVAFGTPLASVRAEAVAPFSRDVSQAVSDLLLRRPGFPPWYLAFMLGIGLLFLAAIPLVYRRFGLPYALFAALAVLFPMTSGLTSMERYVLIDFPVFAAVACSRRRAAPVSLAAMGFYAMLAFMAMFVAGYTLI